MTMQRGHSVEFFTAKRGTFKHRVRGFKEDAGFSTDRFAESFNALMMRLGATKQQMIAAWKTEVVRLGARIVERTPRDTGRAIAGWRGPAFAEKGDLITARLWNSVEYIWFLEYGWSKQAPRGMVRISLHEFKKELNRKLRKLGRP